jgi:hypothetical protein
MKILPHPGDPAVKVWTNDKSVIQAGHLKKFNLIPAGFPGVGN